jgi:hypothetical protein
MGGELVVATELCDMIINLVVVSRHSTGKEFNSANEIVYFSSCYQFEYENEC